MITPADVYVATDGTQAVTPDDVTRAWALELADRGIRGGPYADSDAVDQSRDIALADACQASGWTFDIRPHRHDVRDEWHTVYLVSTLRAVPASELVIS